jgi:hypothetical protein
MSETAKKRIDVSGVTKVITDLLQDKETEEKVAEAKTVLEVVTAFIMWGLKYFVFKGLSKNK